MRHLLIVTLIAWSKLIIGIASSSLIVANDRIFDVIIIGGSVLGGAVMAELSMRDVNVGWIVDEAGNSDHVVAFAGDMRLIEPGETYDWIIVPREALQLLPPDSARDAIANLSRLLRKKGGRLIIDLASFSMAEDPDYYYPENAVHTWHKNWSRIDQSGSVLTRWSQQSELHDRIEFSFRYEWEGEDYNCNNFKSQMTIYKYAKDFVANAIPSGLTVFNVYGDYEYSPWKEGSSRMIFMIGASL